MSADNTICILQSRGADGRPEYRVANVTCLENATYQMDLRRRDNYVLSEFGRCVVYRNRGKARDEAFRLLRQAAGTVQYGIQEVNMEDAFPVVTEAFTWRMQKAPEGQKQKPRRPSRAQRRISSLKSQVHELTRELGEVRKELQDATEEVDRLQRYERAIDDVKAGLREWGLD